MSATEMPKINDNNDADLEVARILKPSILAQNAALQQQVAELQSALKKIQKELKDLAATAVQKINELKEALIDAEQEKASKDDKIAHLVSQTQSLIAANKDLHTSINNLRNPQSSVPKSHSFT